MTAVLVSLRAMLARPFPFTGESWRSNITTALSFGVFVAVFLSLFPPIGLGAISTPRLYFHAAIYGAICTGIMLCNAALVLRLFRFTATEESWTVGKNVGITLWNIMTIAAGNLAYTVVQFHLYLSFHTALLFLATTALIGIFPVTVLTLLQERRLLRRNINAASRISAHLHSPLSHEQSTPSTNTTDSQPTKETSYSQNLSTQLSSPAIVVFEGASAKERCVLAADALICLQSSDNYVTIFALSDSDTENDVQTTLLRMTLKSAEACVKNNQHILRCHKSYIVNLHHVCDISGNAQGYKLHIPTLTFPVPVSRSYQDRVLQALEH